jgi:hypothetical protein
MLWKKFEQSQHGDRGISEGAENTDLHVPISCMLRTQWAGYNSALCISITLNKKSTEKEKISVIIVE